MKKGLFYCQSNVTMGYLYLCAAVCKQLVNDFEIDFLNGGFLDFPLSNLSNFKEIKLPPIIFDFERKTTLFEKVNQYYDFILLEAFPFRKEYLAEEILYLLALLRKHNENILVACSLKDVTDKEKESQYPLKFTLANDLFDVIFVKSDPQLITFHDSFPNLFLKPPIIYTGFQPYSSYPSEPIPRKKQILVTIGTGMFGYELVHAVADTIPSFPDYNFVFVLGVKSPAKLREYLEKFAKNAKVFTLLEDFETAVRESSLVISLGGTTVLTLVHTKTPALVYPSWFSDQFIRAKKFAEKNLVTVITKEDFPKERLTSMMQQALATPYPDIPLNMEGGKNMALEIKRLLDHAR